MKDEPGDGSPSTGLRAGPSTGEGEQLDFPLIAYYVRERRADGAYVLRPGRILQAADEIGTAEAAGILGCSQRRVQELCDSGVLREGVDWRKNVAVGKNGHYKITRVSVMRLRFPEGL